MDAHDERTADNAIRENSRLLRELDRVRRHRGETVDLLEELLDSPIYRFRDSQTATAIRARALLDKLKQEASR